LHPPASINGLITSAIKFTKLHQQIYMAASKAAAQAVDPAALKAQHALSYEASTSEIKDDLPQLLACMVCCWTKLS
jgi:hypothetical protein